MKKLSVILIMVFAVACRMVKVPVGNRIVAITSHIPERHTLIADEPMNFKTASVVKVNQEYWPQIRFKEPALNRAGFRFNADTTDVHWLMPYYAFAYDSVTLIDSIALPEYKAKVWKIKNSHPAFGNYEDEFKIMAVFIKKDGLCITAENFSDFKDSITPQFIAQKLSELEFTVKPKN